jgi:ectoine hydroxylase-related dioxygenase (phytanoyl-CoA dioxygenase family)
MTDVAFFREHGWLVLPNAFDTERLGAFDVAVAQVAGWASDGGPGLHHFEQTDVGAVLARSEDFVPHHEVLRREICDGLISDVLADLFGEPAVLFKDKINFKLPGGDGFKEHQDVQAGWDAYGKLHITAMVAIDETNAENGSVEMIPGMHKQGLLGKMWAPLTDEDTAHASYQPVHCKPGDAVFFDSYAPHRSLPNKTDKSRRVLYITFNAASDGDHRAQYYADKRKNYPPDIERDPDKNYAFKV